MSEPLTIIQRMAENFRNAHLLNKASESDDPVLRISYIAAFLITGYCNHKLRTTKYLNPIIGETYEFIDPRLRYKLFGEQISVYPEIAAYNVVGQYFNLLANTSTKSNFGMNSMEITPIGRTFITLTKYEEEISYSDPSVSVNGLVFGGMHLDTLGTCEVNNHTNGYIIELKFFGEGTPKTTDSGIVEGKIKDSNGDIIGDLSGNIFTHVDIKYKDENNVMKKQEIWKNIEVKLSDQEQEKRYYFSDYACNLNNDEEKLIETLPPTDTRLRKDLRFLEQQDFDKATIERDILLNQQKLRLEKIKSYKPKYFGETYDDLTGELKYITSRDYWKDRIDNNFGHLEKLFR